MLRLIPRVFCLAAFIALPALAGQPTSAPKAAGDTPTGSLVPADSDEYAKFVQQAESGATDIDFLAMRRAYVKSAAFLRASAAVEQLGSLREQMFAAMEREDAKVVQDNARKILAIVYINLDAQKALQTSCKILKDEACYSRYHDIEFGLLKSIVSSGDGKSCATSWEVVTVDEEYFILRMLGFKLDRQAGPGNGGMCDTMIGTEDGKPVTYYFGVERVFEGYKRSLE